MDINNLTNVYNQNPTLQSQYTLQQYLDLFGGSSTNPPTNNPVPPGPEDPPGGIIGADINQYQGGGGGGGIQTLDQTWTQPRATKFSQTQSSNPAAYLTGKGRLDPEGSGYYDTLNRLEAKNPSRGYKMSTFNENFSPSGEVIRDTSIDFDYKTNPNIKKAFWESVYQEPTKQSWWDKTKKGISSFADKFSTPKERGTLGDRLANQPRLPLPGSMAGWLRSPFNPDSPTYNKDFVGQLNYLEGMDGTKLSGDHALMKDGKFGIIEGQSMIGRDPQSGHLKYGPGTVLEGKNVISGFGSNNYETALDKYIEKMEKRGTIDGVFDEANLTDFQLAKWNKAKLEKQTYIDKVVNKKIQEDKIKEEIIKKKKIIDNQTGGGGIDISAAGTIRSADNNFQGDSGPTTQQESDYGYGSDAGWWAKGGRVGLENGGAPVYSESDFPKLLNPFRPTGEKPSLSDYDEDIWDYNVIEIPMGGKMKRYKKFKKRKGGKRRSRSYFDGGLVSLRRR